MHTCLLRVTEQTAFLKSRRDMYTMAWPDVTLSIVRTQWRNTMKMSLTALMEESTELIQDLRGELIDVAGSSGKTW